MTKTNLTALLLLSTALVSLSNISSALAEDNTVSSFEDLQRALTEKKEDIIVVTGSDIKFSQYIKIDKESESEPKPKAITIQGQAGSEILDGKNGGDKSKLSRGFVVEGSDTTLTLKNISVKNFNGSAAPYDGAIYSNGKVVIEADEGKTVEFSNNRESSTGPSRGADVGLGDKASLTIKGKGKVKLESGISGWSSDASVTHEEGTLVLGGDSDSMAANFSLYAGTFTNKSGDVEVRNVLNFFKNNTTFEGGTLKWLTNRALDGKLTLQSGSSLEVGETGSGDGKKTASLILRAKDDLNSDVDITINGNSTLTLQDRNGQTLNKQVKGDGTLDLKNTKLTLSGSSDSGLGESLKLKASSNSTLTLKNLTETAGNTLKALATALTPEESSALDALHLVVQGYNSGTGNSTLTVDGQHIADLSLETGENKLQNVTVKNSGKMTNKGDSTFSEINNEEHGTIENFGNLTAESVKNSGTIRHYLNTFDGGVFENKKDATFKATGNSATLKAKTLTNSGTIDLGENDATVETLKLNDKDASFTAKNLTTTVFDENKGTVTLSGTLTVTATGKDDEEVVFANPLKNEGKITAQKLTVHNVDIENTDAQSSITVHGDAHTAKIDNHGTFTVDGKLEAHGDVTNETDATLTFADGDISGKVTNSGTVTTTGTVRVTGAVENNKDWTNSGTLTFAGAVSGNGKFDNSGDLNLNGDASGFTGDFTQTAGTTTVNGKMFKGTNNINGGSLDVTQDKLDYGVTLGSNATWKHNSTTEALETIDNNNLTFSGSNSQATFTGSGGFTLSDQVTVNNNKVVFENTKVSLDGTDFNNVGFKDSSLNLHDDQLETKAYTFTDSFMEGTNKLHFDVRLQAPTNDKYKFTSDTVKFKNKSSGLPTLKWTLGNIYIGGEEVQATGKIYEGSSVLQSEGAVQLGFVDGKTLVSTNKFEYKVSTSTEDAGKVTIKQLGVAGDDPLATMNKHDGNRQYGVRSNFTDGAYHSQKSLDSMENGDFSVFGENNNREKDVLSGKLVDDKHEELTERRGSFFDLEEGDVSLHVKDLTIQDAGRTDVTKGGGSVLRNNNANARVDMSNLIIQNNSSSGKGGAIYNNGGTKNSEHFTSGLYLTSSTLKNNEAGENGKGGAIYNDQNGYMILDSVTVDAWEPESGIMLAAETSLPEGKNDVYNEGDIVTLGQNTFNSLVTNADTGTATFAGDDTFAELHNTGTATATFSGKGKVDVLKNTSKLTNTSVLELQNAENTGTVDNTGMLTLSESFSGSGGSLSNEGDLSLTGDASEFKGAFNQTGGATEVTGTFFGGKSDVSGGSLFWNTDAERAKGTLTVHGDATIFELAENKKFTLGNGDSINAIVGLDNGSTMTVQSGDLTLKEGSVWEGTINVEGGDFNLDTTSATQPESGGILNATGGKVTLGASSKLRLDNGSMIGDGVKTTIGDNATVYVAQGGTLSLNEGDTTQGHTVLDGGTLKFGKGVTVDEGTNATLEASRGNLNILEGATLDLTSKNSFIDDPVALNIAKDATLKLSLGSIMISDEDKWDGNINLAGGNLYYATTTNGNLTATSGNLTLLDGSVMTIGEEGKKESSTIGDDVVVKILEGSTLNVDDGASLTLGQKDDVWQGTINNNGGSVKFSDLEKIGGAFNQESGDVTFENSQMLLHSDLFNVKDGGVALVNSYIAFDHGSDMNLKNLSMSKGSTFGFNNGAAQTLTVDELTIDGVSHFTFDVDFSNGKSDQIVVDKVNGNGTLDVSEFGVIGKEPNAKSVEVQLFAGDVDNLDFTASADQVRTALGYYDLTALEDNKGWYRATLSAYNPNAYRGQVSQVAMLYNQLGVDDMVLHHLILDHAGTVSHESSVAKTRRVNQAVNDGRGANVWVKPYYDGGKLSLSEGLDVDNNAYGLIAGADMPMGTFDNGWQYVPTFYVAYNGADQSYDDVDMKQNGGQAGFMTTFMKDNFVAAANVYGGAYENEMEVENFTDKTDGWFAGVSARAAYNAKLNTNLTLQPALFASYNMFSKQDWDSDFGNLAMEADALNGYNVAPELNLIYTQNDWSVYGMLQYMFTFDQDAQGKAEETDLPDIGMDGDYFQYGAGVAKIWNKALSTNFQVIGRSGSRTDVGVRLGVQYMFN